MTVQQGLRAKPKKFSLVRLAHASLQFSDIPLHKRQDYNKIFMRADVAGVWAVTGTEAGDRDTRTLLQYFAQKWDFKIYFGNKTDCWVAVRRSVFEEGSFVGNTGPTIINGAGITTDKKVVSVSIKNPHVGKMTFFAAHNVKADRPSDQLRYMKAYGVAAQSAAAGNRLAFMGADGNRDDRKKDPAFGNGFISCWDDLGRYPGTGHGTIDYIFRWKNDGRVKIESARSFDDNEMSLHMDHFYIEADYKVQNI